MDREANSTDTLDITFTSMFAWMLIIFGAIFFGLGVALMLPFIPRQNAPLGVAISAAALAGIAGGCFWRTHLPVVMRLTPEELEVRGKLGGSFRWLDMERVDLRSIYVKGEVRYVCIKLKPEAAARHAAGSKAAVRGVKALAQKLIVGDDYDVVLDEQTFSASPSWLVQEFQRRISLATAQARGCPGTSPANSVTGTKNEDGTRDLSPPRLRSELYVGKLGPLVKEFPPTCRGLVFSIVCSSGCFAAAAAALALPLWKKPQPGDEFGVWALFGSFAALFGLMGLVCLWPRSFSRRRFTVCRDGLEVRDAGHTRACPWASILGVERRIEETLIGRYLVDVLVLAGSEKVDIDRSRVRNAAGLIKYIAAGAGPLLAQRIDEQLRGGQTVSYGVLTLTPEGIQACHDLLPWHTLARLDSGTNPDAPIVAELTDGEMAVVELRSQDVPNLEMLTPLIKLRAAEGEKGLSPMIDV